MVNKKMYELGIQPSDIRQLFEYGKERKSIIGEENVFDFSLGNPNVPCPEIVNNTLIDLIENMPAEKLHGYTSAQGDINVRKAIVNHLNNKYNEQLKYNYVYMTAGAAASLTISLNAIINEGDEVIVIAPYFPEYKVFIEKAKGVVNVVNSDFESFKPNLKALDEAINEKTKAIIINYPNNPTGVLLDEKELLELTNIINEKQKKLNKIIYLISDEPYRELVYNNKETPFITKYYNNSIICYSFSKSLSLPGERIGYILLNPRLCNVNEVYYAICGAGRSLGYVCAPSLFQYMIPNCLGVASDLSVYEQNKNILYEALTNYGYEVIKPEGAFYIFMKALGNDAYRFCELAKQYELLLVPSNSFGCSGYVRISYCVSQDMIRKALPSFKKMIEQYKG